MSNAPDFLEALKDPRPVDQIMSANARYKEMIASGQFVLPINAAVGVVMNQGGSPLMPEVVATTLQETGEFLGYQSPRGNVGYLDAVIGRYELADPKEVVSIQTAGGTDALSMASVALRKIFCTSETGARLIYDAGWPNYINVFEVFSGWSLNGNARKLNDDGRYDHDLYQNELEKAEKNSVVLLQASGYNGDGLDRSDSEWSDVVDVIIRRGLVPIIDSAYSGLVTTDNPLRDFGPLREFIGNGYPVWLAYSNSKNMGFYGMRVGGLFGFNIPAGIKRDNAQAILDGAIRATKSNLPHRYAEAARIVLPDDQLFKDLAEEQDGIRLRIDTVRQRISEALGEGYEHVARGKGLFTVLRKAGYTPEQHKAIEAEGIASLESSRLNLGGFVSDEQIERVIEVLSRVLK